VQWSGTYTGESHQDMPFWAARQNVQEKCTTRDGTDHSCMKFDLWRPDKIFLFSALAAILCSKAEHVGDVHN
jgi:hypothetical protein